MFGTPDTRHSKRVPNSEQEAEFMPRTSKLAVNGGPTSVTREQRGITAWPIITKDAEEAVLEVLRRGAMSGRDVTMQFEREYAEWHGVKYALGHNTGTASLQAAMWACGVGVGDEIIAPSYTYWASALPVFTLQGTVVFADIHPDTLTIDPRDIEHRVTDRTKAIVAVHIGGYPCDLDPILDIAARHDLSVIEDVSHAHGGLYKGRLLGTIGHVGCFSIMSGKALAVGEAGMLITDDRGIWERATVWGHYGRTTATYSNGAEEEPIISDPALQPLAGLPWGGYKYRMHQLSAAVGRVQLRQYKERMEEIQKAMNTFWDLLEGCPGVKAHRPAKDSGSAIGGWYAPRGLYRSEELGGLPLAAFSAAVRAEGTKCGSYRTPMHLHPLLLEADIYGHGKPTRIANSDRDLRQYEGSLPVTEAVAQIAYGIPWFKHHWPEIIEEHANAYRKVAEHADELL